MKISSHFDSGNIDVVDSSNPSNMQLNIRKDNNADFYQWFHFRVEGVKDQALVMHLLNAKGASFPDGWHGYRAVASYDRETWFRVDTEYDDGVLTIAHKPAFAVVNYAYFAPYSHERHLDMMSKAQLSGRCELSDLGQTVDGRDMSLLTIGNTEQRARERRSRGRVGPR